MSGEEDVCFQELSDTLPAGGGSPTERTWHLEEAEHEVRGRQRDIRGERTKSGESESSLTDTDARHQSRDSCSPVFE